MDQSIVLVVWTNKDHPEGISRQITIPAHIDPRSLSDANIWSICYDKGLNIYGDMTWEILINNSQTCHQTDAQIRAGQLYERLAETLIDDAEAMEALHDLYEIAYDSGGGYE